MLNTLRMTSYAELCYLTAIRYSDRHTQFSCLSNAGLERLIFGRSKIVYGLSDLHKCSFFLGKLSNLCFNNFVECLRSEEKIISPKMVSSKQCNIIAYVSTFFSLLSCAWSIYLLVLGVLHYDRPIEYANNKHATVTG